MNQFGVKSSLRRIIILQWEIVIDVLTDTDEIKTNDFFQSTNAQTPLIRFVVDLSWIFCTTFRFFYGFVVDLSWICCTTFRFVVDLLWISWVRV